MTLHKAIIYAKEEWGFNNTYIIYASSKTDAPKALKIGKYNSRIINPEELRQHNKKKGIATISYLISNKRIVRDFYKYITYNAPNHDEKICIVVFRDTLIRESLLTEKVRKNYKNVQIIMIEEGLALYANSANPTTSSYKALIKSILYRVAGIPTIALNYVPHGCNPTTDIIICSRPQLLKDLERGKGDNYIQEIDVFNKDNCSFFIHEVMMTEISDDKYDFVFLTQPLFPTNNSMLNKKYDDFLVHLFSILSIHGRVLIKTHPRDTWDYYKYTNEHIHLCPSELMKCAYEIIAGHYGAPQTITLFSSAACNAKNTKKILFLYDFFPEIIDRDIFSDEFIKENNIIRCKTFNELQTNLS